VAKNPDSFLFVRSVMLGKKREKFQNVRLVEFGKTVLIFPIVGNMH